VLEGRKFKKKNTQIFSLMFLKIYGPLHSYE